MKLDRNENDGGMGKYALINLRRLRALGQVHRQPAIEALEVLEQLGIIDRGARGATDEFFVVKLKDKYAPAALHAYANAAWDEDHEFATEVTALAVRAEHHPDKKTPD